MKQQIGRLLSTLLLATFSLGITAGVIQGTIIDKQTKEPLTGATVQIAGTTTGTVADVEGNYTLTLSNGTYTIEVKYIGYKTLRMNEVKVKANATLNFELEVDAQTLDAVTVVARKNLEGEKALLQERQKATLAIENMGAKEMTLKGISNVQDGVKKITGISIASAGQLIVRGLGDRYSTTTLNGLPIASPNPDNKLIPLDLFPASTVKNITVSKVYAAGAFADYSGAHIDISTKENTGSDFSPSASTWADASTLSEKISIIATGKADSSVRETSGIKTGFWLWVKASSAITPATMTRSAQTSLSASTVHYPNSVVTWEEARAGHSPTETV